MVGNESSIVSCVRCGNEYPSTPDFWFFKGEKRSEFCKECERQSSAVTKPIDIGMMRSVLSGEVFDTSIAEHVRDRLVDQLGGVNGLVSRIQLSLDAAKPGSNADVQLLKMVLQFIESVDRHSRSSGGVDLETADLVAVIRAVTTGDDSAIRMLEDANKR